MQIFFDALILNSTSFIAFTRGVVSSVSLSEKFTKFRFKPKKIVATRVVDIDDCHWNYDICSMIKNVWFLYGFGGSNGEVC